MRVRPLVVAFCCGLVACTPLGFWLYEEPRVGLHDLLIDTDPAETALPPYVILNVHNRNDYTLSIMHVEMVLRLDGRDVGRVEVDTAVTLTAVGTHQVRFRVPPLDADARQRIVGLREGLHRYAVMGRVTVETPIGTRRVAFRQEGRAEFGAGGGGSGQSAAAAGRPAPPAAAAK